MHDGRAPLLRTAPPTNAVVTARTRPLGTVELRESWRLRDTAKSEIVAPAATLLDLRSLSSLYTVAVVGGVGG